MAKRVQDTIKKKVYEARNSKFRDEFEIIKAHYSEDFDYIKDLRY